MSSVMIWYLYLIDGECHSMVLNNVQPSSTYNEPDKYKLLSSSFVHPSYSFYFW